MGIAFFEALRRHAGVEQEEIFQQDINQINGS